MARLTEHYRGYTIAVTPIRDDDDLWDFDYFLSQAGTILAGARPTRSQTLGGYAAPDIAGVAGLEVAKIEIDNLLALQEK